MNLQVTEEKLEKKVKAVLFLGKPNESKLFEILKVLETN